MKQQFDLVCQLGSQVMDVEEGQDPLANHTRMRTRALAIVLAEGIAPIAAVLGGSNFGVRYDENKIFNSAHPTIKEPDYTFRAFAEAGFKGKSEAIVIEQVLAKDYGIQPARMFPETLSATTEENARFLLNLLKRRPAFSGVKRIGVLTLLYHMERALPVFRKALQRMQVADKAIEDAGLGYDPEDKNRPQLEAGIQFFPIFAENVLASSGYSKSERIERNRLLAGNSFVPAEVEEICAYYRTPKGGKQYDVHRLRQLLEANRSLAEMWTSNPRRNPFGIDEEVLEFDELLHAQLGTETMEDARELLRHWQLDHPPK